MFIAAVWIGGLSGRFKACFVILCRRLSGWREICAYPQAHHLARIIIADSVGIFLCYFQRGVQKYLLPHGKCRKLNVIKRKMFAILSVWNYVVVLFVFTYFFLKTAKIGLKWNSRQTVRHKIEVHECELFYLPISTFAVKKKGKYIFFMFVMCSYSDSIPTFLNNVRVSLYQVCPHTMQEAQPLNL